MSVVAAPCVVVHRTKTAGYQVIYESASRRRIIRGRNLSYVDALKLAATVANVQGCQIRGDS